MALAGFFSAIIDQADFSIASVIACASDRDLLYYSHSANEAPVWSEEYMHIHLDAKSLGPSWLFFYLGFLLIYL